MRTVYGIAEMSGRALGDMNAKAGRTSLCAFMRVSCECIAKTDRRSNASDVSYSPDGYTNPNANPCMLHS
jgi:hypothetical protein